MAESKFCASRHPARGLFSCAALVAGLALGMSSIPAGASLITYSDLASFNSASSTVIAENFEAVGAFPRDVAVSSFSHNGITFTGLAGARTPNVWVASPGYVNFGVPTTTTSILTANGDEDFTVAFSTPTTALGFDTYLNIYGPATINVFGASGLMGTFVKSQDPTHVGFWGVTSDNEPITSIRWTTVNGGLINTGIDNIRLGTSEAVPEPTSLALFGFGAFLAVMFIRRRRSARL